MNREFPPPVSIIETKINVPILIDANIIKGIQTFQINNAEILPRLTEEDKKILLKK